MSTQTSHSLPPRDEIYISERSKWRSAPMVFALIGVAGLAIAWLTSGADHKQAFFFSYLTALMFWLALGLGGLFFVAVQHATRAGWSIVVRRIAENLALTLPLLGVLALPVVFIGTHDLFHWSHAEVVATDPMLTAKAPYLNEGAFRTRGIISIGLWAVLAYLYWSWSTTQDESRDPVPLTHKMRWFAPLTLIIFALSMTFGAAIDWLMSLDPHWFSTVFGVYYFAGCVISVHSFIALAVIILHRLGYLRGVVTAEHFHDLGKMMFAFTVFWAYIAFSQYMLIWYASIPEETYWYAYRGEGQWLTLSIVLVFARFALPFVGIMSRKIKRNPATLAFWAVWMLIAQLLDMFWLVHPVLAHDHKNPNIDITVADFGTFIGIGGLVLAVFTWACAKNALVPIKDPRLLESLHHENA